MVGLPSDASARKMGSALQRSRSSSLPVRSPPSRGCSWPTKAWVASTQPKWSALPKCSAISAADMGITIVWVEHIMGVLMRVVDRVIVLDHGEKIFEGVPGQAAVDPRVTEVYLGKKKI